MIAAPDSLGVHPVLEQMAHSMFLATPRRYWPLGYDQDWGAWEKLSDELREWFRDRARTFAAGDMRVAPWCLG